MIIDLRQSTANNSSSAQNNVSSTSLVSESDRTYCTLGILVRDEKSRDALRPHLKDSALVL